MQIIGLTGSIAVGKSTVVQLLKARHISVFEADEVVHQLYAKGGKAVPLIRHLVPKAIRNGAVDRHVLSQAILKEPSLLVQIERLVHPLVQQEQKYFIQAARWRRESIVVLDIPLLLEKRTPGGYDEIVVVTCPVSMQKERALRRKGMTSEKFVAIRSKQLPEWVKVRMATYIINSGFSKRHMERQVERMLSSFRQRVSSTKIYFRPFKR